MESIVIYYMNRLFSLLSCPVLTRFANWLPIMIFWLLICLIIAIFIYCFVYGVLMANNWVPVPRYDFDAPVYDDPRPDAVIRLRESTFNDIDEYDDPPPVPVRVGAAAIRHAGDHLTYKDRVRVYTLFHDAGRNRT